MPPQPPQPRPDGDPTGRYQRRRSAPGGHPGGHPTGRHPTGGYPGDYQAPYPQQDYQEHQEYQAPSPAPRQYNPDDYPSGEYPTAGFTGGFSSPATPGNQHDMRATGTFNSASDPMSRYEQYSVYDEPKHRTRSAAVYHPGGRASRSAAAATVETPWYRETWMVAVGLAVALLIGVALGAVVFG